MPSDAGSRHSGSRHASSGRGAAAKPEAAPMMPTVSNASAATSAASGVVVAKSGRLGRER